MLMALLLAVTAAEVARPQPDLDWLAGYWLSCADGREVAESWSDRRGAIMLGASITFDAAASSWEQMRIEAVSPQENGLSFFAQPRGAAQATEFRLVRWGEGEAQFENASHDFPQRVIYRREGDLLIGRIEGRSAQGEQAMEWRYRSAPFNSRCPTAQ